MRYSQSKGTPEQWVMRFCGHYAENKLKTLFNMGIRNVTAQSIESDRRRENTVAKALRDAGVAVDWLHPSDKIETLMAPLGKMPAFNTKGYIEKADYYIGNKITVFKTGIESYKNVTDLDACEIIYVYLHQDEFDLRCIETKEKRYRSGYSSTENITKELRLFPKALLNTLDANLFRAKAREYATNNMNEALQTAYGLAFRSFKTPVDGHPEYVGFDTHIDTDKSEWLTVEKLDERLIKAQAQARFLARAIKELKVLRRKAQDDVQYEKTVVDATLEYLHSQAPLWVVGDDKYLKGLAMQLLNNTTLKAAT
jgi:hypothetical protein